MLLILRVCKEFRDSMTFSKAFAEIEAKHHASGGAAGSGDKWGSMAIPKAPAGVLE